MPSLFAYFAVHPGSLCVGPTGLVLLFKIRLGRFSGCVWSSLVIFGHLWSLPALNPTDHTDFGPISDRFSVQKLELGSVWFRSVPFGSFLGALWRLAVTPSFVCNIPIAKIFEVNFRLNRTDFSSPAHFRSF